jgi:cyclophilin family peptidyl-prolyl cis-trans isomerase
MFRRIASFLGVCLLILGAAPAPVRAQSASDPVYVFHTSLGDISVQLYPDVAPQTVANFLNYVNSGAYQNSIIHRSVPGFVIQGGGFQVQNSSIIATPTNAPVVNEFHISNTRGTIAMAKLGNNPNSATSQWFFNLADNSNSLDSGGNPTTSDGGFTVFGKITDAASLAVMDEIAGLPTYNLSSTNPAFNQTPLANYQGSGNAQFSNLVTVSSITPAAGAHILWDNTDGTASIWNYSLTNGSFTQNTYGPYPNWTAKTLTDGPDGLTRVLWDNADGTASIWSLNNTTGQFTQFSFGPYTNWTAKALSVGTDNTTHVLWTNTDGTASLWNYSTADGTLTQNTYGPYPGWTATALADGPDGQTRLLWNNADGTASIWSLNNNTGVFSQYSFGPYSGWTAKTLNVGTDNTTHVLWTNTNGTASLWNYSTADGTLTQNTCGPYAGWTVTSVADGADGQTRLLWDNTDGTMSLWDLNNVTGVFGQFSFGPYPGWTATATTGQ